MELMDAVDDYIPQPVREVDKPFLMPVEDVFTITGRGTVVTGRIERGVDQGQRDRRHHRHPRHASRPRRSPVSRCSASCSTRVSAGENVGLLLRGTKREDVERGMVVIKPGTTTPHTGLRGSGLHPLQGGGRPPHAVLQQLPAAVLLPHHGRDRRCEPARGHRHGDAWRQHRHDRAADPADRHGGRAQASPSVRAAVRSAPVG